MWHYVLPDESEDRILTINAPWIETPEEAVLFVAGMEYDRHDPDSFPMRVDIQLENGVKHFSVEVGDFVVKEIE